MCRPFKMSRLIWHYINVAIVLVVSADAACPSSSTVIDLCDSNAFGGNNFYIDAARMAEGHHQCSCTLSTNEPNTIEMVEVTTTNSCRTYWYNASFSVGQVIGTFTYEYQNGACVFPHVWGHLTYSSIPWSISITRRGDGPPEGGEGDPGVCMQVFSVAKTAFIMKCGNASDVTTSKVIDTSATSSLSPSTTATPTSTGPASTPTTATFTSVVSISTATESMLTPTASTSTATSTSAAVTPTSATAISTSSATTSTSAAATSKSAAATSATSSQIFGRDSVYTALNTSTTAHPSTSTSSASRPASHETLHSTLDFIAIGASLTGLLLVILLVTLCIYIGHQRWKTYSRKDLENVVYVTDNIYDHFNSPGYSDPYQTTQLKYR